MKMNKSIFLVLVCTLFIGCSQKQFQIISPSSQKIEYVGRINFNNPDSPVIYWSGSSVTMRFTGSSVSARLSDELGKNYFNVVIDNDSIYPLKLAQCDSTYVLAENLDTNRNHTISLVKRNEWITGSTSFNGFEIKGGEVLDPLPKNGRLIEFYGNSITAGYAIENYTGGDSPDSTYTNNYVTYAAQTARHYKADVHCIVRSGIGIQVSWDKPIMPEIYNRLDPRDSTSTWDFTKVVPDIVVINLLQNDSWLVNRPDYNEFKCRFGEEKPSAERIIDTYAEFVKKLRDAYPKTPIICALGSMDATMEGSPWPGYVKTAVESLHDDNIYTHFFPFIEKGGHPRVEDDTKMAASLISFIDENISW